MKLLTRKETTAEQLKHAAIEAAVSALGDAQGRSKGKPTLSGVRAVGAGAVLFTAARVAVKRRRFLRRRLSSNEAEDEETRDPDATSGPKPARPLQEREPVRRAAREKGLQPSLDLPQQRWPRMSATKR